MAVSGWALLAVVLLSLVTACTTSESEPSAGPSSSTTADPDASGPGPSDEAEDWGAVETSFTGSGPSVVILGDSITVESRPQVRAALDGHSVKIAAVLGEGLSGGPMSDAVGNGGMPEIAATYAEDEPAVAVVALGTNDAWKPELSLEAARAALDDIVAAFDGTCLVTVTITEASTADDYDRDQAAQINQLLREAGDQVVDWGGRSTSPSGGYVLDDGIHPTPAGSELFADLVRDGVRGCTEANP